MKIMENKRAVSQIPGDGKGIKNISDKALVIGLAKAGAGAGESAREFMSSGIKIICVKIGDASGRGLEDLTDVKRACPEAFVMADAASDCSVETEGLAAAGADGVILSPSKADKKTFAIAAEKAAASGLFLAAKISDALDIAKVRALRPSLVILNLCSKDLSATDRANPIILRSLIDWECRHIYGASEIMGKDISTASGEGFHGAFVNKKEAAKALEKLGWGNPKGGFWTKLFQRKRYTRPFVQISGLARPQDANLALSLGADIISFPIDEDNAKTVTKLLQSLGETESVKALQPPKGNMAAQKIAAELTREKIADAMETQEEEELFAESSFVYRRIKAPGLQYPEGRAKVRDLLDPYSITKNPEEAAQAIYSYMDGISKFLWIAGTDCGNVKNIVKKFRPELIEVSAGLDAEPGIKDPALLRQFFKETLYGK